MRTYYRGPDAVVDELQFVWRQPEMRIFLIDDLDNVRLLYTRAGAATGVAVMAGLGLLGASATAWHTLGAAGGAPLLAAAAILAVTVLRLRHKREWQIRATYHAHEVKLYASTDPRIFHQVARSLRRSIEGRATRQKYRLPAG